MKRNPRNGALLIFLVSCALLVGRCIGYDGSYGLHTSGHVLAQSRQVAASVGVAVPGKSKEQRDGVAAAALKWATWALCETRLAQVPLTRGYLVYGSFKVLRE